MDKEKLNELWQNAGLTNDFIFSKVFLDPQITLELLRRIFPELIIKKVKLLNSQQELKNAPDAKGVRFDIYVEDEQHDRFDIEMQLVNHHNLPQRACFYQANLASSAYEKGTNYSQANDSYVIFFCCFDPFGLGNQQYEVERVIRQYPSYPYRDGEKTVFFNVPSLRHEVGQSSRIFLMYWLTEKLILKISLS
ncbi:Rpn family recombination-promoting nuclease/putative transposase [Limosilactobacillus avistercoris]|uniref:Rpn family recombination-promoting nuclease/putative transposase n=1 Tax=Limosilactobacillus avistercoris TaxID=2762243 RepID=UPI001CD89EA8|nr:Rpn family recombination-promoting nuclease/putative transposase [Limosilactobacillus avistercoris]